MHSEETDYSLITFFYPLTNKKIIFLIVFIGIITYFNGLFNNFVGDDFGQIVYNSAIHSIRNIPILFRISTFDLGNGISGIYYKPLLLFSYTIIYSLFGLNAFYFHFFQLILFIANTILLYFLLKKFINLQLSFILSILFLVHPINQSIAGYIADFQDTQFFFFGMLALLFSMSEKIRYSSFIVFLLLVLSLLSKETGVVFVLINIFYICLFKKKQFISTLLLSIIILVCYGIAHFFAVGLQFTASNYAHISRLPFQERLINIPDIILFYLQKLLFPINLSINYDWVIVKATIINFYIPLVLDLLIFIFFFIAATLIKKRNITLFGPFLFFLFWFLVSLGFHIQIIPLDATVSTSWFYLPYAGLLGMFGIFLQVFLKKKRSKIIFNYIITIFVLVFLILTIIRNSNFANNLVLTCHDANITKDYSLENSCGNSLAVEGQYIQAQKHLELSVQYAPYYYANWYTLGTVLGIEGTQTHNMMLIKEGENDIRRSIAIYPSIAEYYDILGYLYLNYNSTKTSITFLTSAVKRFPRDYKLWLYLSMVEAKAGNTNTAIYAIKTSHVLNSNNPDVIFEYSKLILHRK